MANYRYLENRYIDIKYHQILMKFSKLKWKEKHKSDHNELYRDVY